MHTAPHTHTRIFNFGTHCMSSHDLKLNFGVNICVPIPNPERTDCAEVPEVHGSYCLCIGSDLKLLTDRCFELLGEFIRHFSLVFEPQSVCMPRNFPRSFC